MSLRISSLAFSFALVGCGAQEDDRVASALPDDRIDCAVGGATDFARRCAIERQRDGRLILRHADGGFRTAVLAADGTLSAADGSDDADGRPLADGRFELALGKDRYRLPARR